MGSLSRLSHYSAEQVINYGDDVQYMSSMEEIEPYSREVESGVI